MPELPEVETIVRDLDKNLKNRKIVGIKRLDKKIFALPAGQAKNILSSTVRRVSRRAKILIFDLGGNFLIIHLKMTGQLVLKTKKELLAGGHPINSQDKKLPNKFTRVIFKFNDGSLLYFNDVRRFGWLKIFSAEKLAGLEKTLGVEPLSPKFSRDFFKKFLERKKNISLKQSLMDQKYIAGIGNIYADESLFAAGLKPFRKAGSLKPAEAKRLWLAIPKILKFSIRHRGTSFNDYVDARGRAGNFVNYLKVYGRAGEPCFKCRLPVKKIKFGGRGTHWCDHCQK